MAAKFKYNDNDDDVDHCENKYTDKHTEDFKFDLITPDFVFDQICNFSNNKSTGVDSVCIRLLKLAAPIICHTLACIYVTFPCSLHIFPRHGKWQRLHLYTKRVIKVM